MKTQTACQNQKKASLLLSLLFIILPFLGSASDYYWVGGSGKWSDYSKHWSTTSGGQVFHVQIPTPFDNVIFDANSFSSAAVVTMDTTHITFHDMTWTGVQKKPQFTNTGKQSSVMDCYGSLILDPLMYWAYAGNINFNSDSAEVINTGNIKLASGNIYNSTGALNFLGDGEWSLSGSLSASIINLSSGTLRTNNNKINCERFIANSMASLFLGNSAVNCSDEMQVWSTLDTGMHHITIGQKGSSFGSFYGHAPVFYSLTFLSEGGQLFGNGASFNSVVFKDGAQINGNNK